MEQKESFLDKFLQVSGVLAFIVDVITLFGMFNSIHLSRIISIYVPNIPELYPLNSNLTLQSRDLTLMLLIYAFLTFIVANALKGLPQKLRLEQLIITHCLLGLTLLWIVGNLVVRVSFLDILHILMAWVLALLFFIWLAWSGSTSGQKRQSNGDLGDLIERVSGRVFLIVVLLMPAWIYGEKVFAQLSWIWSILAFIFWAFVAPIALLCGTVLIFWLLLFITAALSGLIH